MTLRTIEFSDTDAVSDSILTNDNESVTVSDVAGVLKVERARAGRPWEDVTKTPAAGTYVNETGFAQSYRLRAVGAAEGVLSEADDVVLVFNRPDGSTYMTVSNVMTRFYDNAGVLTQQTARDDGSPWLTPDAMGLPLSTVLGIAVAATGAPGYHNVGVAAAKADLLTDLSLAAGDTAYMHIFVTVQLSAPSTDGTVAFCVVSDATGTIVTNGSQLLNAVGPGLVATPGRYSEVSLAPALHVVIPFVLDSSVTDFVGLQIFAETQSFSSGNVTVAVSNSAELDEPTA